MKLKVNTDLVFLYVIILFYTSFFGIIKISSDIALCVCVLFEIYEFIKYSRIRVKYKFKWSIIFIVALILISSIRSNQLYGQSLFMGIRAQRQFFFLYMLYFPITKLLKMGKITVKDLEKMIYRFAIIQLALYTLFYILKGNFIFKYNYDYRYGGMRLRVGCSIINLLFIFSIQNYIKGIDKIKNIILIMWNIAFCVLMLKTRLIVVGYIVIIFITFLLWKKNWIKRIVFALIGILMIPIVLNSTIISDTIDTILENDTNDIRTIGKAFYMEEISKSPLTGRGYINTQCTRAYTAARMDEKIYLNDNGIFGFTFVNGFIGVFWFVALTFKLLKKSINLYKKENYYIGIMYIVFVLVLSYNIIHWYWVTMEMIMFAIVIAIIEFLEEKENEVQAIKENALVE